MDGPSLSHRRGPRCVFTAGVDPLCRDQTVAIKRRCHDKLANGGRLTRKAILQSSSGRKRRNSSGSRGSHDEDDVVTARFSATPSEQPGDDGRTRSVGVGVGRLTRTASMLKIKPAVASALGMVPALL